MTSRLIHPRMLEMLKRDFFPMRGRIQQPTKTQSTTGQEKLAWADVPGWVNIHCRKAGMGGGERRYSSQTFLDATDVVILAGTYNGLTEAHRFMLDEQAFDILRVEPDSEGITTRLILRTAR